MADRYRANYQIAACTYCCGAKEIGGLLIETVKQKYYDSWAHKEKLNPTWTHSFNDKDKVWPDALKTIRKACPEMPVMFNIVVDEPDTESLRKLLSKEEDGQLIHTWKNPNTGNLLEMYILTNDSRLDIYYEEDNDDDY
jgi:hypothetical protein